MEKVKLELDKEQASALYNFLEDYWNLNLENDKEQSESPRARYIRQNFMDPIFSQLDGDVDGFPDIKGPSKRRVHPK